MNYIFPGAFAVNALSMTGLLIVASLAGDPIFAANIGLVQAATLALFYAFSGNTRSAILNSQSGVSAHSVFSTRLILLIPLAIAAYWLSSIVANVPTALTVILILRRSAEWFDEIYLSEMERLDAKHAAMRYTLLQTSLLAINVVWMLLQLPFILYGLFLWAVLPLIFNIKFHCQSIQLLFARPFHIISKNLLPHIGSSMIIGMTVYIFRLLLTMVTGKSIAGDLITAFAIGGVLGSVVANAVGPSLALHQKRHLHQQIPRVIQALLLIFFISGVLLFALSILGAPLLSLLGKTHLFWQAVGLSMVAGVVMVFAQIIRHRLLQHHEELNLFGPDVIMNILIIAAVPFGYYLFGEKIMVALYLWSAILAYLFYKSYEVKEIYNISFTQVHENKIKIIIIASLLIPLFFQIQSGIFNYPKMIFDTQGKLSLLPIPLSVMACFLGILIIGKYQQALVSLTYIFSTFILMIFSTFLVTEKDVLLQGAKLVFLIQFIMPMFGLVLGQFIYQTKNDEQLIEKTFMLVLFVFVPAQLISTWIQGIHYHLSPYLYILSVYQHLQYVPVIFTSAYFIALVGLWDIKKYQIYFIILTLCMSIYVAASLSLTAMLMFYLGLFGFSYYKNETCSNKKFLYVGLLAVVFSVIYATHFVRSNMAEKIPALASASIFNPVVTSDKQIDSTTVDKNSVTDTSPALPSNLLARKSTWQYYYIGITQSSESLLFGQATRPDRLLYPSAHNYYLDFIYNFGLLSILPFIWLFFHTSRAIAYSTRYLKYMTRNEMIRFITLSSIVLYLLLIDNFLKVSLRQPYSGVFTFFLWGLLLSKLSYISKMSVHATPS